MSNHHSTRKGEIDMLRFLKNLANRTHTENGAAALRTTGDECLDLFATIGALRNASADEIAARFVRAYAENPEVAMKMLFMKSRLLSG
jgi:hypothetical protein